MQSVGANQLQRANQCFERTRDFVRWRHRWESDRRAYVNGNFLNAGEATVLPLHLPYAIDTQWNDGDAQILREDANPGSKWQHLSGLTVVDFTFRKNQNAVAAVD